MPALAVPLLREDRIIGGLVVRRKSTGEFRPEVIELFKTFATQSVLAIQNARLFREIEEKSRQIEAANRHKSEFLANMSHELRTPLNAIIGFSEVLGERLFGELNEKQAEYTDDILTSGRHLLSLINEILDLSKVEAGRMELELATFDLPLAIDNARTFVRERATRHGITLDVRVDERLGDFVGDERKIKQILLNLLSNAVKFTPEGGRIGINARPTDGSVEISVTDTGIGIAPEDQPKIFEEFRQVGSDYAHKDRRNWTGINAWPRSSSSCMEERSGWRAKWAKAVGSFLRCRSDKSIIPAKAQRRQGRRVRRIRMALQVKRENVPEKKVVLKTGEGEGSMIIRQAYGNESSLLVALRPPGYHTWPHMHVSEQINHVLEGEIWFFVEDKGYHCMKEIFTGFPADRVHWAWNRSDAVTTVVESHSPPLVGGDLRDGAAALFDENERPQLRAEGEINLSRLIRKKWNGDIFPIRKNKKHELDWLVGRFIHVRVAFLGRFAQFSFRSRTEAASLRHYD